MIKNPTIEMPLYVVGHRNPDTDAICAAIGYADLLRRKGESKAVAARCGPVPARTAWVLEQAGMEKPLLIDDVNATAEMICRKEVVQVNENETFLATYRLMLSTGVRSIPVVNDQGELRGLLKYLDLLQLLMPSELGAESVRRMQVSPEKIQTTLEAKSVGAELESEEREIVMLVGASSPETVQRRLEMAKEKGDVGSYVVMCGDRPNVQRISIEYGVRMLVVTSGFEPPEHLIQAARENGVGILSCNLDTASAAKLIRCSRMVSHALNKDVYRVLADESVRGMRKRIANHKQDLFPVVNPGDNSLIGVISKSDLIDPPRIRMVMVDHNEYSQAVEGVEDAEVLEVIDHHRLAGDIISREPIRYLNEPVGSTSTLVAREYRYAGIEVPKPVAKCLIAGMISDTLNLTSPTTTDLDREILQWLCGIAEVDAGQFTRDFFASGSLLAHGTSSDAVGEDRKVFEENGARVSISHVEEAGLDFFDDRREELMTTLDSLVAHKGYDLALMIVTDINKLHSVLLASGDEKIVQALPFDRDGQGVFQAPGVVSRKKQVFPAVCQALRVAAASQ
ncbi:putative manganese-dependent inorganic diphosphatase [Verrucomicrobiaceae bacterium N1E253]|uniref:inorganic diphosphatase n=1 Tax=Oceaniferula marina TaxID=2748318 RepID=A0A851GJS2_9BACT|nr:putative manganese-dependent inorganic diphosphatase [Oceaniferula marina]NWK54414.1 putative manganese-dependent inorganic diphosphatase [Oceaniferula marina]